MTDPKTAPQEHGPSSAIEAMLEAAMRASLVAEHRTAASAMTEDDYRTLVDLAWRYQFDDRMEFKRAIREMEQIVGDRMWRTLEARA